MTQAINYTRVIKTPSLPRALLWALGLLLLLHSALSFAEPKEWMKRSDPNNLAFFVNSGNECPFSKQEIEDAIKSEFLRARIKTERNTNSNDRVLFLYVGLMCMDVRDESGIFIGNTMSYDVFYGTSLSGGEPVIYLASNYGGMGSLSEKKASRYIIKIKDAVSRALTDYLKANVE